MSEVGEVGIPTDVAVYSMATPPQSAQGADEALEAADIPVPSVVGELDEDDDLISPTEESVCKRARNGGETAEDVGDAVATLDPASASVAGTDAAASTRVFNVACLFCPVPTFGFCAHRTRRLYEDTAWQDLGRTWMPM